MSEVDLKEEIANGHHHSTGEKIVRAVFEHDARERHYRPEIGHEVVGIVIERKSTEPQDSSPSVRVKVMGREPGFRLGGIKRRLLGFTVACQRLLLLL